MIAYQQLLWSVLGVFADAVSQLVDFNETADVWFADIYQFLVATQAKNVQELLYSDLDQSEQFVDEILEHARLFHPVVHVFVDHDFLGE